MAAHHFDRKDRRCPSSFKFRYPTGSLDQWVSEFHSELPSSVVMRVRPAPCEVARSLAPHLLVLTRNRVRCPDTLVSPITTSSGRANSIKPAQIRPHVLSPCCSKHPGMPYSSTDPTTTYQLEFPFFPCHTLSHKRLACTANTFNPEHRRGLWYRCS